MNYTGVKDTWDHTVKKDKIPNPAKDFLKEGKPKVQSDGWVEVGVFGSLYFSFEVNLEGKARGI